MSTQRRDVSGLYDKSQVGPSTPADGQVDRSAGVAPPPRSARPAATDAAIAASSGSVVEAPVVALVVDDPAPARSTNQVAKLALAFTADQMNWLRKAAARRDLWLGELFDELFVTHQPAVTTAGVQRRSRGRRGSNYTGTRLLVVPSTASSVAALASELGVSKAAVGRAIVDTARSGP